MNSYNTSMVYRNVPDTFKTTYRQSYTKMPTLEVSPAYDNFREKEVLSHYPIDLSPYPYTRDDSQLKNKKPYQLQEQRQRDNDYEAFQRDFRSRYENGQLQKDAYREQRPQNRQYSISSENTSRGRETDRVRPPMSYRDDRAEQMRAQYDELLADGQQKDVENKLAFCNKCFKSNACMNRLGCTHQYCDECMSRLHGSDNPFRDTIRWHFCCDICRKWTSEAKIVRLDPYGRRLFRYI